MRVSGFSPCKGCNCEFGLFQGRIHAARPCSTFTGSRVVEKASCRAQQASLHISSVNTGPAVTSTYLWQHNQSQTHHTYIYIHITISTYCAYIHTNILYIIHGHTHCVSCFFFSNDAQVVFENSRILRGYNSQYSATPVCCHGDRG